MFSNKLNQGLAVGAALVSALILSAFWFYPESDNKQRLDAVADSSDDSLARPAANGSSSVDHRRNIDKQRSSDATDVESVESVSCTPLDETERQALRNVSRDWYGKYGDASAKRYWPYQTIDNDILKQMSEQDDTEAMFQLGMNMLWQALRAEGTHWFPEGSTEYRETPFRDEVDKEKFYEAWRYLLATFDGGMIFATRELSRTFIKFDSLDEDFGFAKGREGFTAQEWKEINIASLEIMENYFFPTLPNERLSFDLTDRQRTKAEALAANHHSSMVRRYEMGKVPMPELAPPPDAVQRLVDDDQCLERLAQLPRY